MAKYQRLRVLQGSKNPLRQLGLQRSYQQGYHRRRDWKRKVPIQSLVEMVASGTY